MMEFKQRENTSALQGWATAGHTLSGLLINKKKKGIDSGSFKL